MTSNTADPVPGDTPRHGPTPRDSLGSLRWRAEAADERDARADARERVADERDAEADRREAEADRREAEADRREREADARERRDDLREALLDHRWQARPGAPWAHRFPTAGRPGEAAARADRRRDRKHAALRRTRARADREQDQLARQVAATWLRARRAGDDAQVLRGALAATADEVAATFERLAAMWRTQAESPTTADPGSAQEAARRIRAKADEERREGRRLRGTEPTSPPRPA